MERMNKMNQFYMIFVEGGQSPTYRHQTLELARKEAERLATLPDNIGKNIFVLSSMSYVIYNPFAWYPTNTGEIPF
jgi:hypothetical protein